MASNLYEVLGLDKDATPEAVRKAYRKKALSTHPDRLPPNTSEAERQVANEQFRLVNNAYEVLNDAQNRKLYDQHGVWPPPTADATDSRSGPPFETHFDRHPWFDRTDIFNDFHFRDPIDVFNSFFGDLHYMHGQMHDDPWFDEGPVFPPMPSMPMFSSPFGVHHGSLFGPSMSPFGPSQLFGRMHPLDVIQDQLRDSNVRSYSSVSQMMSSGGQWASSSTMTRTVNGRTETITKRRDAQGNEHITYSSPEGERYTINGVDQPVADDHYLTSPYSHPPAMAAPPNPPAINYGSRASAYHNSAQHYNVPISSPHYVPPPPQPRAVPIQKRHSTAEAYRSPPPEDGIRRSSSSRHHQYPEREPSHKHRRDGEHRQSPAPHHSRESARGGAAEGYFHPQEYAGSGTRGSPVDLTASPPLRYSATPPPPPPHHSASPPRDRDVHMRSSRHEPLRSGRVRDDGHHGMMHGARRWLSGLGRLFKWQHHDRDERSSEESSERYTPVSQS